MILIKSDSYLRKDEKINRVQRLVYMLNCFGLVKFIFALLVTCNAHRGGDGHGNQHPNTKCTNANPNHRTHRHIIRYDVFIRRIICWCICWEWILCGVTCQTGGTRAHTLHRLHVQCITRITRIGGAPAAEEHTLRGECQWCLTGHNSTSRTITQFTKLGVQVAQSE